MVLVNILPSSQRNPLKKCKGCEKDLPVVDFNYHGETKDGRQPKCRKCLSKYKAVYDVSRMAERYEYRARTKSYIKEKNVQYYKENKERLDKNNKDYYHKNKDHETARNKLYLKNNRGKINKYIKEKKARDPDFKAICACKARISNGIRCGYKTGHTKELLGCDAKTVRKWLEAKFKPGMTWQNHGKGWHMDHIHPVSSFIDVAKDPQAQREAFRYTNLQPLWWWENNAKLDMLPEEWAAYQQTEQWQKDKAVYEEKYLKPILEEQGIAWPVQQ